MQNTAARILHRLMLTCEQATYLIVKGEDGGRLSPGKKIRLTLHLLICKFCRAFKIQSRLLNRYIHDLQDASAEPDTPATLDPGTKLKLETLIRTHTDHSSETK